MTAGEGGSGTFASIVRDVEQVIAETICPARRCHAFRMCQEPVTKVWKDASSNLLGAYGEVVELWTRNGHQYEDNVVGKEGAEHDEGCHLKLLVATEEIIEIGNEHQREIADIA